MVAPLSAVPAEYIVTASDREAIRQGYGWSPAAVEHVYRFSRSLRDPNDPSRPYRLLPWQSRETARLFGWRRSGDRRRRFTRLNCWIPKKNGKSSWLAFLALYFLVADGERRPGVYIASGTAELAAELYREAKAMTRGTAWRGRLRFTDFQKLVRVETRHGRPLASEGGRFQSIACSAEGSEGLKGSFVCIDEIHATLKREPELYGALRFAGSGRRQPMVATISTAGDDQQSLPYEIYQDAKRILDGSAIDLETLAIVYELDDRDEYSLDEMVTVNPGIGHVLTAEQLAADYAAAKAKPHEWEAFLRYRLNVWTAKARGWLNVNDYLACRSPLRLGDLAGRTAYLGVDLSGHLDLTAACAVVPLADGRVAYWPHYWLPEAEADARAALEMDYRSAAEAGHMTLCETPTVDYGQVGRWILSLRDEHGLKLGGVGFDPWKARELAAGLEALGLTCWQIKQGWAMSEPSLAYEADLKTRRAIVTGNPVEAWCVANSKARRDGNGKLRPVKLQQNKRIDGLIAAIMGRQLAMFETAVEYKCA